MSTVVFNRALNPDGTVYNNVVQVVSTSNQTSINNTSGSWVSCGVSTSITPRSASNKILCIYTTATSFYSSNAIYSSVRLVGRGTQLAMWNTSWGNGVNAYSSVYENWGMNYLDSPNTTNTISYNLEFLTRAGASIYHNYVNINGGPGTLTLMELEA